MTGEEGLGQSQSNSGESPGADPGAGVNPGAEFDQIAQVCRQVTEQLSQVIVGQQEAVRSLIAAVLCQGHALGRGCSRAWPRRCW